MQIDIRYPVTRYLYRPLSTRMAAALAGTKVTPLQVTWLSAVIAIVAAVAFALGAYVAGAVLTFVSVITDCVDGDLARLTSRSSKSGAFLDSVLDRWTDAALIIGIGFSNPARFAAVAAFALVASLLTSYTRARAQSLGTDCPEGVGGRDARLLVLIVAALVGQMFAGLIVVAILGTITSVHRTAAAARSLERMDRASRAKVES